MLLLWCLLPLQRDAGSFTREPVCLVRFLPPCQQRHLGSRACAASLKLLSTDFLTVQSLPLPHLLYCLRDRVRVGKTKEKNERLGISEGEVWGASSTNQTQRPQAPWLWAHSLPPSAWLFSSSLSAILLLSGSLGSGSLSL